jgi:hypothetical protein
MAQDNPFLSLKEVPVPVPKAAIIPVDPNAPADSNPIPGPDTDLSFQDLIAAGIVRSRPHRSCSAGPVLGHAGRQRRVQACATCHFNAAPTAARGTRCRRA